MPARRVVLLIAALLFVLPLASAGERRGMEYDIVREALADAGYELVPVFVVVGEAPSAIVAARGGVE